MINFLSFLKYIFQYLTRGKQNLVAHRLQTNETLHNHPDTVSGCLPIETNSNEQPVPGTVTQGVSTEEKLLQTPIGEVITISRKKGIRCGCSHFIYSIEPEGSQAGLGGQCMGCSAQAAQLLNHGVITLDQAEAMSLYCSQCSARCDACGTSVCRRHIHQFINLDNSVIYLCDECLKQAERDKFFKQALTIIVSPFLDDKRLPPPGERRGPNE